MDYDLKGKTYAASIGIIELFAFARAGGGFLVSTIKHTESVGQMRKRQVFESEQSVLEFFEKEMKSHGEQEPNFDGFNEEIQHGSSSPLCIA